MRQCSTLYNGMFETNPIVIKGQMCFKKSSNGSLNDKLEDAVLELMTDSDFFVSELAYNCQTYKIGDLVVLNTYSADEIEIGLVRGILVREDRALLIVNSCTSKRSWLRFFRASTISNRLVLADIKSLSDFKPLINYGTAYKIYFCLHHHISHDLD